MDIEMLVEFIKLEGRYQVYSDGKGNYSAMPIHPAAIHICPEADKQLRANCEPLNYNNQMD
ncbi:hypothetical protein [Enterobacter asburiae]|uniref:hypothetical protein n=1 Tax=Enterobacter asburiae TaxID=61645 RepID=UPI0021CF91BA|nr:hypothetical protein [Enterobacter asburiae]MCU6240771.1 hypothetical protein [Enterobacter asburiae]